MGMMLLSPSPRGNATISELAVPEDQVQVPSLADSKTIALHVRALSQPHLLRRNRRIKRLASVPI